MFIISNDEILLDILKLVNITLDTSDASVDICRNERKLQAQRSSKKEIYCRGIANRPSQEAFLDKRTFLPRIEMK